MIIGGTYPLANCSGVHSVLLMFCVCVILLLVNVHDYNIDPSVSLVPVFMRKSWVATSVRSSANLAFALLVLGLLIKSVAIILRLGCDLSSRLFFGHHPCIFCFSVVYGVISGLCMIFWIFYFKLQLKLLYFCNIFPCYIYLLSSYFCLMSLLFTIICLFLVLF